jgi:hypothetical protein
MKHRRVRALLTALGAVALASLAAACFSDNTNPTIPDATADDVDGLDTGAPLDAPAAPDTTMDSDSEAIDATSPAPEAEAAAVADANDTGAEAATEANAAPDTSLDAALESALPDAADATVDSPDAHYQSLGALSFDGINEWVHLPAATGGASEVAFSVELWFRSRSNTGNMFEVYGTGGGADRFLSLNTGAVCFYVYASPITQVCTTAATYGDNAWHHAAGTLGAGGVNLYVDGVLAASSTAITSSTFTADTDFSLGFGHTAFDSATVYFQGDLDEVRVWSVELSATDITANYRQTIDPATTGLQGYWMLEESGSSSVAHDATSGAHDGQLTNYTFTPSPWISPGAF